MYRKPQRNQRNRQRQQTGFQPITRVRLPRGKEVLGIVDARLGYGKSRIICNDGKTRICRVPGHLKRELWVRPDNIVLVEPWEFESDVKGDIIYRYTDNQADWLKKNGYLKDLVKQEF
jgi:translation initiation factor 1A